MLPTFAEMPRFSVEVAGIYTSYCMMGKPSAQPVVLLHGMSTAADSFRETVYGLADEYCLIAPDIPGFGYSGALRPYTFDNLQNWLYGFCHALDLPPLAMVGHSFGGMLAAAFALAYPKTTTRLLLAAPSILRSIVYPEFLKKVAISLRLVDLGSAVSQSPLWVQRQIKTPFYDPNRQDKSVWQRRLVDYGLARQSADVIKAAAFCDLRPLLPQLEQPVCLVWGENDSVVTLSDGDKLLTMLPLAELHILPKCGHVSILEQPAKFQAIARDFL